MQINVTNIIIMPTDYHDRIILHTDLPNAFRSYSGQPLMIGFDCDRDASQDYVKKNFPNVPVEVINMRKQS